GRIDIFRRENAGVIGHEQIVTAPQIHHAKWDDLLKDLRKAIGDAAERFSLVYLVDDFVGSGTTLLREEEGVWKGKLLRFWEHVIAVGAGEKYFEPGWKLCVHHYLSTDQADHAVRERDEAIRKARGEGKWFESVEFSSGMHLQADFPIKLESHRAFAALVEKYYDDSLEDEHISKGGENARLGFGKCALP